MKRLIVLALSLCAVAAAPANAVTGWKNRAITLAAAPDFTESTILRAMPVVNVRTTDFGRIAVQWDRPWTAPQTDFAAAHPILPPAGAERFVTPIRPARSVVTTVSYGPFRVLDDHRVQLVGATGIGTPELFAAMMRDHPGLTVIEMVECPGTEDDRANLRLGRMIKSSGLATYVPRGGSVRSGAVELFLAGSTRAADPSAEFAVHAWQDRFGKEPRNYAPDAPQNRAYLDYYAEMGFAPGAAKAFYAMTNSVPNAAAKWMTAAELRDWVAFKDTP